MNNNMRNKGRSAIYMMAGFYLIYMAYQVFKNRAESAGGEYIAVMAGAAAFFLIGAGMMGFSWYLFYKTGKEMHEALEQKKRESEEMQKEEEKLDISENA